MPKEKVSIKRGRPQKDQNEVKDCSVTVRLSREESEYLDKISEATGMSKSRILRAMIKRWGIEMCQK